MVGTDGVVDGTVRVPCDHRQTEELGWSGTAAFFRCVACGTALIQQADQRWILRARPPYAASPM